MSWLYTLAGLLFLLAGLLSCMDGDYEWAIVNATIAIMFNGLSFQAAKGEA